MNILRSKAQDLYYTQDSFYSHVSNPTTISFSYFFSLIITERLGVAAHV